MHFVRIVLFIAFIPFVYLFRFYSVLPTIYCTYSDPARSSDGNFTISSNNETAITTHWTRNDDGENYTVNNKSLYHKAIIYERK